MEKVRFTFKNWGVIVNQCFEVSCFFGGFTFDLISCSFTLMQKNQKIKAEYKFHTYVHLGKARKTRLERFEPHPDRA